MQRILQEAFFVFRVEFLLFAAGKHNGYLLIWVRGTLLYSGLISKCKDWPASLDPDINQVIRSHTITHAIEECSTLTCQNNFNFRYIHTNIFCMAYGSNMSTASTLSPNLSYPIFLICIETESWKKQKLVQIHQAFNRWVCLCVRVCVCVCVLMFYLTSILTF